jgi:hypothetical protein
MDVIGRIGPDWRERHYSSHSRSPQQISAVGERFAGQRAVKLGVPLAAVRQAFGMTADEMSLLFPINRCNVDIVGKPHERWLNGA